MKGAMVVDDKFELRRRRMSRLAEMVVDEKFGLRCRPISRLADTYEMVDDPSTDSIISWSESGKSFIVWNPEEFSRDVLPRFFRHKDFSSFVGTLTSFGFRKVDSERLEFADDDFVRGEPKRIRNIHIRPDSDDEVTDLMISKSNMLRKTIMKKKKKRKMTKKITAQLQSFTDLTIVS